MRHYFIESEGGCPHEITVSEGGCVFRFSTCSGLFSYKSADAASLALVRTIGRVQGSLLDMGCGWGMVGIMLATFWGASLVQADINRIALEYARKNALQNGVAAHQVYSDCFDAIDACFDTIAINPPIHAGAATIRRMYIGSREHLNPGGALYVVIHQKHGAKTAMRTLGEIFGNCAVMYKKKGLHVLCMRREA